MLQKATYHLLITDLGRGSEAKAGLQLLEVLAQTGGVLPAIVYTSGNAVAEHCEAARQRGAVLCTAGTFTLLDGIRQIIEWWVYKP